MSERERKYHLQVAFIKWKKNKIKKISHEQKPSMMHIHAIYEQMHQLHAVIYIWMHFFIFSEAVKANWIWVSEWVRKKVVDQMNNCNIYAARERNSQIDRSNFLLPMCCNLFVRCMVSILCGLRQLRVNCDP